MIVKTKALVIEVHGKDLISWFQCTELKSSQTIIVCFIELWFWSTQGARQGKNIQDTVLYRNRNYFNVLVGYGEPFEKGERFKEKITRFKQVGSVGLPFKVIIQLYTKQFNHI